MQPVEGLRPASARRVGLAAGILAALVGAGHLVAWWTGAMGGAVGATTITMKANAAFCLVLAAVTSAPVPGARRLAVSRACALVVLALAAATLFQHASGLDLRIDQLLATEPPGAAAVTSPNRMGPPASLAFTLLGAALVLLTLGDHGRLRSLHQPLGLAAAFVSLVPTVGYLYGADELFGIARYTGIAFPTAVSVLVLAAGVLAARPGEGLMTLLTGADAGAALVRRLLPPLILLPIAVGWIHILGERQGWFDRPTGTGLAMLVFIVVSSTMVLIGGQITRRHEVAVRRNEGRLSAALGVAELGIWEYDTVDGRTTCDDRCRQIYGLTDERPLSNHEVLALIHPADRARVKAEVAAVLRSGAGAVYDSEYRVVRGDGTERWVAVRAHPTWPDGDSFKDSCRLVGTVMDITERRRAEEELRQANARLAEADRRKDEFIAILSHELRNPLAPIRYALPLLEREALPESAARAVSVIGRQVDQLTKLVEDFLDVSRVTHGRVQLHLEETTVDTIVKAAVEAAAPVIVAGRHSLTTAVPEEAIWVKVDPRRLTQVITNLLNNSARYTPTGGRIHLEAGVYRGQAVIRVRDNGMGIDPAAIPTLFEMFRQLPRPDRPQGGLGIGLAYARRLVELHGGTIEAHSPGVGEGAEFVVRLPLASPQPSAGTAAEAREAAAVSGGALRVLVVDDNTDSVHMLGTILEQAGHAVRKALDGRNAVSVALSYRPDVVLLDLGLPGMSGLDVARELRRHPETAGACLVALTGWGQPEDRERTREAGFAHHLTKPADPDELCELLRQVARGLGAPEHPAVGSSPAEALTGPQAPRA